MVAVSPYHPELFIGSYSWFSSIFMSLQPWVVYLGIAGVGGRGQDPWFIWPIMCACSVYTVTGAGMSHTSSSTQELVSLCPDWVWPWVKESGLKDNVLKRRTELSKPEQLNLSTKASMQFGSPGQPIRTTRPTLCYCFEVLCDATTDHQSPRLGSSRVSVLPSGPNLLFSSDCFIWLILWTCPPPCPLVPQYKSSQEKKGDKTRNTT